MQVKNASFFQLHIEKIILAAGVLFLLIAIAVVVFGVILKPYQVELGNKTYDNPSEVIPVLVEESKTLERGLQTTNAVQPKEVPADYVVPDLETNYREMLDQPTLVQQSLAPISRPGMLDTDFDSTPPPPPSYVLPSPPMVADIEFKHGFEVLDTQDPDLTEAYFELWGGDREPADFSYVFIEGRFDFALWIERLQATPTQGQRVPLGIWNQKLGLATVVLIRERRDPVTGEWGDRTVVPMLPDQFGVVPGQEMPDAPEIAQSNIEWLLSRQTDVAQPAPPPLTSGGELLPPLDDPMLQIDQEALDAMAEAERAEERARRRAEAERRRAERAAERDAQRNNNGGSGGLGELGPGGPAGGRGGAGSGRGGSSGRDTGRPGREPTPVDPRGGRDTQLPGRGGLGPGGLDRGGLGTGVDNTQPEEEGKIRVWAVDVTVEPGTTYRYKLVAGVINPLYGVARLEKSQLSENRHRAVLLPSDEEIDQAPWIEPIEIEPSTQFYVVRANERGASINVWRVHDGDRVKHTFDVNPGDPIGGTVAIENEDGIMHDVDMAVGATVVDIDRRKDINGQTVWTLIYIDDYGKLHERSLGEDQSASSQFERRLREEREARERAMDMLPNSGNPGGIPGEFDEFGPGGPLGPGGFGPGAPTRDRTGR